MYKWINVLTCKSRQNISNRELQFRKRLSSYNDIRNKPGIPVSSRVTSIIRLECRRNKWSNHPPTLTIWRKQSSTAIHPYIVARTKSLATADLRYALYINQLPPAPPPRTTIHTLKSLCIHAISRKCISNFFMINIFYHKLYASLI